MFHWTQLIFLSQEESNAEPHPLKPSLQNSIRGYLAPSQTSTPAVQRLPRMMLKPFPRFLWRCCGRAFQGDCKMKYSAFRTCHSKYSLLHTIYLLVFGLRYIYRWSSLHLSIIYLAGWSNQYLIVSRLIQQDKEGCTIKLVSACIYFQIQADMHFRVHLYWTWPSASRYCPPSPSDRPPAAPATCSSAQPSVCHYLLHTLLL